MYFELSNGEAFAHAGGTVLHWAAATGNKDLMAYLMERAVDVDCASYSGQTPLHVAAACGHDNVVSLLLSDNAKPDVGMCQFHSHLPLF